MAVNDTSSSAASAHVNAYNASTLDFFEQLGSLHTNVMIGVRVELIVGIGGHLPRLLAERLSEG